MEDINFKKFICYILNCIGATENDKLTVFYVDKELKKIDYDAGAGASKIAYDDLKHTYADNAAAGAAAGADAGAVAAVAANSIYTTLNDNASNIKQYFNIKQVPSYITIKGNKKQLDVSQSIHQAFNLIKVFFDAKKWYLQQYKNLQNPISRSNFNFGHDGSMYGGFDITYDNANKNVANTASYDKFLGNVLKDFIYMITDKTNNITSFDVTTLYVLSKINYYLAKRYAVLSIKNNPAEFYEALNQYSQATAYDNSFFNNFTYYTKEIDDKDYPRYYQKEILELLKTGRPTEDNDVLSYLLTTETNKKIDPIADQITYDNFNKNLNRTKIYKSLFTNERLFEYNYDKINTNFDNIHSIMQNIITYADQFYYTNINKTKITLISSDIRTNFKESKIYNTEINNIIEKLTTITIASINIIIDKFDDIKAAAAAGAPARGGAAADAAAAGDIGFAAVAGNIVAGADTKLVAVIQVAVAAGAAALRSYYDGDNKGNAAEAVTAAKTAANKAKDTIRGAAGAGAVDINVATAAKEGSDTISEDTIKNVIVDTDTDDVKAKAAAIAVIAHIVASSNVITNMHMDIVTNINAIKNVIIDIDKIIQKYIQYGVAMKNIKNIYSEINTANCKTTDIKTNFNDLIETINKYKSNHVAVLFKSIKPYIKKYSNNTFSSVYKSPTFTYSVTPINIRPLVYKRATETDLSNYAAQIASDSFLNSNKLPAIPDFKSINKVIGLLGGAPDINNGSNVYRTIFNKILNALNAKRIKLNDDDIDKVNTKLNDLEEIEQYLKSTLSDYAKYASVTHQKGTMVGYNDVKDFLNDYENKLREYNKKSASVVRFIGRLTPYLYSH